MFFPISFISFFCCCHCFWFALVLRKKLVKTVLHKISTKKDPPSFHRAVTDNCMNGCNCLWESWLNTCICPRRNFERTIFWSQKHFSFGHSINAELHSIKTFICDFNFIQNLWEQFYFTGISPYNSHSLCYFSHRCPPRPWPYAHLVIISIFLFFQTWHSEQRWETMFSIQGEDVLPADTIALSVSFRKAGMFYKGNK